MASEEKTALAAKLFNVCQNLIRERRVALELAEGLGDEIGSIIGQLEHSGEYGMANTLRFTSAPKQEVSGCVGEGSDE